MTMIRIACVGITVMDRIYYVEDLPTEGGKYVAKRYTEVGGGPRQLPRWLRQSWARRWTLLAAWAMTTPEKAAGGAGIPGVNTRYTRRYVGQSLRNRRLWLMRRGADYCELSQPGFTAGC
jgi:hypothetical protein